MVGSALHSAGVWQVNICKVRPVRFISVPRSYRWRTPSLAVQFAATKEGG